MTETIKSRPDGFRDELSTYYIYIYICMYIYIYIYIGRVAPLQARRGAGKVQLY